MRLPPWRVLWRSRKAWAWTLAAVALLVMVTAFLLPSYQVSTSWSTPVPESSLNAIEHSSGWQSYRGYDCAWVAMGAWEDIVTDNPFGSTPLSWEDSLVLSYFPANLLFVISPLALWLTGRTRWLGWVFRGIYVLLVLQVLGWWIVNARAGDAEDILIGYWFWLGAFCLLAAAFWVMPRGRVLGGGLLGVSDCEDAWNIRSGS